MYCLRSRILRHIPPQNYKIVITKHYGTESMPLTITGNYYAPDNSRSWKEKFLYL